ncbi:hypothetical protein NEOLEDRAFT_1151979 [Neolentinus lepideus HHB14362 ss-1]|uniref:Uncharacterized protein n=1 Tax=Neolentinus lepideus HHB14362 ss-1 TaxID=1314782 RepID=A0A165NBK6_9AGAM|nr:hypothetical protein NEOLEDRAFT_1151979 [Neolentinus lepideus HHB14362 ss-1]
MQTNLTLVIKLKNRTVIAPAATAATATTMTAAPAVATTPAPSATTTTATTTKAEEDGDLTMVDNDEHGPLSIIMAKEEEDSISLIAKPASTIPKRVAPPGCEQFGRDQIWGYVVKRAHQTLTPECEPDPSGAADAVLDGAETGSTTEDDD